MITAILIVSLALVWLLIESDFMTVRLPAGKAIQSEYKDYEFENESDTTPLDIWKLTYPDDYAEYQNYLNENSFA